MITPEEFANANARGKALRDSPTAVLAATYNARRGRVIIHLRNGLELSFDPKQIQGLTEATPADLRTIEVSPMRIGLHFPSLDADIHVPSLLAGALGSSKWMAAQLGASGGQSRSPRKKRAARANGKLGGRPRKNAAS
jgi:hypothetical protein